MNAPGVLDVSASAIDLDKLEQDLARFNNSGNLLRADSFALVAEVRRLRKEVAELTTKKPRPLTKRQSEVLAFVQAYIDVRKISPTLREIGEGLSMRSDATVHEHLSEIERKGWIVRADNDARSIEIKARI